MASLREIQRRMSSIRSTMQITRTMEMISTARIQRALARAEEAEPCPRPCWPQKGRLLMMLTMIMPKPRVMMAR